MAVELKFSSDDKDVVAALQRMTKAMEALRAENKRLKDEAKAAHDESKKGLDGVSSAMNKGLDSVKNMAAGFLSVGAAVDFVSARVDELNKKQERAATVQVSTADAEIKFLRNLGQVTDEQRKKAIDGIQAIARESGQRASTIYAAASSATSAKGKFGMNEVLDAVRQAARLAPEDAGEMAATAGGLLDIANLTKTADAKQNMGFMLAMGAQTRVENLELINKNLVPGAIGAAGFGGTAQEAGGLVTTLTSLAADPTGAGSKTASIALAKQLEESFPEKDRFEFDAKGKRKLAAKGTGLTSTAARIEALQANASLSERFMSKATFEKDMFVPVRELLTGGTDADRLLETNIAGFPGGADAASLADKFVAGLETPLQKNATLGRSLSSAADVPLLAALDEGKTGMIKSKLDQLMENYGADYTHRFTVARAMNLQDLSAISGFGTPQYSDVASKAITGTQRGLQIKQGQFEAQGNVDQSENMKQQIDVLQGILDAIKTRGAKNINAHIEN